MEQGYKNKMFQERTAAMRAEALQQGLDKPIPGWVLTDPDQIASARINMILFNMKNAKGAITFDEAAAEICTAKDFQPERHFKILATLWALMSQFYESDGRSVDEMGEAFRANAGFNPVQLADQAHAAGLQHFQRQQNSTQPPNLGDLAGFVASTLN